MHPVRDLHFRLLFLIVTGKLRVQITRKHFRISEKARHSFNSETETLFWFTCCFHFNVYLGSLLETAIAVEQFKMPLCNADTAKHDDRTVF